MDIFSHGLWAGAAAKAVNLKREKKLNWWFSAFWGVFPDLFAFMIPFALLIYNTTIGRISFAQLPRPESAEPPYALSWAFDLSNNLYNISHSLFVFLGVFLLMWLIFKRPVWEMGGWFLHILFDVPTHSYEFYPTPALWPFFDWRFDGFVWGTWWFIIANYTGLILAYILLRKKKKPEVIHSDIEDIR